MLLFQFNMPRKRIRKTEIGQTDELLMRQAVKAVLVDHKPERAVARDFGVKRSTLQRYVKKCKDVDWNTDPEGKNVLFRPNYACRQVFTNDEEKNLSEYLARASRLHHGLPPKECRKLAYEFAVYLKKNIPQSWAEQKCAGEDWLEGFIKRVGNISLRKPEATSLARSMGFNKPVVSKFYEKLSELLTQHKFGPENIYNLDESGVTTVQNPGKVIAPKGAKHVGQVTSAERGELVTICCTMNAVGNAIPPYFVFPRVKFVEMMLNGAPTGSKGATTSSGWMNSELFIKVLEHFIKHSKSSPENKTLLLMDNHESHISIEAINFAKSNGVILYTIPPHCSHKLQPLDKTVFGPLKKYFNEACRSWLVSNPGKRITIYQIAELVGISYPNAFSINNITSGFKSTGIYPFNNNVYCDADFIAASVTDVSPPEATSSTVPLPTSNENQPSCSTSSNMTIPEELNLPKPVTPEAVRPFPKAPQSANAGKKRGRKVRVSEVLTDTPVKTRLEEQAKKRLEPKKKKQKIEVTAKQKENDTKSHQVKRGIEKISRQLWDSSSEEDEWCESESDDNLHLEDLTDEDEFDIGRISVGDFVLIKIKGKTAKTSKYYIAEVIGKTVAGLEVKYMKRNLPSYNFVFGNEEMYLALEEDIERKLPKPTSHGGTERTLTQLSFPINLESYGNSLL